MKDKSNKINTLLSGTKFLISRYGGGAKGARRAFAEAVSVLIKKGPLQVIRQAVINIKSSQYFGTDFSLAKPADVVRTRFHSRKVEPHEHSAEIIICVHNALDDVRRCLSSVIRYTLPPYRLILVDDGSQQETKEYLAHFSNTQSALLIRNEEAKGYTLAANQGLRASQDKFVLLLNSDTVVSEGWLDRMVQCAISSEQIGMVGPLSNTASWQSIPELLVDGDWAANPLPDGVTVESMALLVAKNSKQIYPRLSFLNGFCLLIKRGLIEDIGYFDEETFGQGFCEENDYCLRTRLKGWELAVADDVYIYHAQSKSYTNERRKKLAAESDRKFVEKFSPQLISNGVDQCRYDPSMLGIRAHAKHFFEVEGLIEKGRLLWEGKTVAFLLPDMSPSGNGDIIVSEALAMQDMGGHVTIVTTEINRTVFEKCYAVEGVNVIYVSDPATVANRLRDFDAVIATTFRSVKWLAPFANSEKAPRLGYYIQTFEPYFFDQNRDASLFKEAMDSYALIPTIIRLTKTRWTQAVLKDQLNLDSVAIGLSVDSDLFRPTPYPEKVQPSRPLRVTAMIVPDTSTKSAELTLRILCQCKQKYGEKIEVLTFGCEKNDPIWQTVPTNIRIKNLGIISKAETADIFNQADILADFSLFQPMGGCPALEAMASGVAVIVPAEGGINDFARNEGNTLLVDSQDENDCLNAVERLIGDRNLREKIQRQAITDVAAYSPVKCSYKILNCLFPENG